MNRTYRLIWNELTRSWVAVAETVRAKGKKSGTALLLSAAAFSAHALPTGGEISAGSGAIVQSGTKTTISQSSQNLAINWQSFNIGAAETVNFVQPNAAAIALNRVLSTDGSQILGTLKANGQVWILNPNGVLFGKGAQVNVGGLVASTLNISDADFMAGKRTFSGNGGTVTNQGEIAANYVALLGEQVKNEGVIVANLGTVALAAGNKVTLDFAGDKLLGVQIDEGALHALVDNKNLIQADGGLVVMTAKAKDALLDTAVNNSGIVRARTLENRQGKILLLGDMKSGTTNVGGTLDASAPDTGDGGFIETSAAKVGVGETAIVTTKAAHGKTGTWLIDPVDFTIAASGGDMTGAVLTQSLNGTNVTILSTDGAAGTAGDINVNDTVTWSANTLTLNAQNNININSAMMGSGTAGLALEYGQGAVAAGNTSTYNVNAPVNLASTGSFSTKLGSDGAVKNYTIITTLGAAGSVTTTDLQGMNGNRTLNYVLGADIDASATSGWNDNGAGGFYGFAPIGTTGVGQAFTGGFDGLGHTVSNLYINRPATDYIGLFGFTGTVTLSNVGLVDANVTGKNNVGTLLGYSATGIVNNSYATGTVNGGGAGGGVGGLVGGAVTINDSHADVTVSGSGPVVGGLVGSILHINRSYATGNVSGINQVGGLAGYGRDVTDSYATGNVSGSGSRIGGLVGLQGSGSISNSYATGSVGGTLYVGGLVGYGETSGVSIATSYASGAVTGSSNGVGGLAGIYQGAISNSYATGSASGASGVGGLVGDLDGSLGAGTITNSYATGAVTASVAFSGGLLGLLSGGASVTNSYWDTVTTGQATSAGGAGAVGMTTAQLAAALPTGFASATWGNAGNQTTPYLLSHSGFDTAGPTYLGSDGAVSPTAYGVILNVNQLQAMGNNLAGNYVLGNDIDASATSGWNGGAGFVPVGSYDLACPNCFSGSFDGLGHSIDSLTINRPATDYVGLFGYANAATLRNVGLTAPNVTGRNGVGALAGYVDNATSVSASHAEGGSVTGTGFNVGGLIGKLNATTDTISGSYASSTVTSTSVGNNYLGGLVGYSRGAIANSYATGAVNGTGSYVGGLAGAVASASASVSNSYATGAVSGNNNVGGLAGAVASASATISNSYATGAVSGNTSVGGLVGANAGSVTASYWNSDVEATGIGANTGTFTAVGKTTAEMKSLATFAGWDIDAAGGTGKVWRIYDGYTNPLLRGFLTALNVQPDYDGSGAAMTDIGAAAVVGAHDAGKVFTGSLYADTLTLSSTAVDAYTATSTANNLYSNQQGYDLVSVARSIATPGSASGDIALTNPISWTSGTLAINTTGTISQTAAINGSGTAIFDLQAGTWNQVNATLPGFSVYDFRISGGSFIRALSGDGTVGTPYQLADIYGIQGMGSSGMLGLNYQLANDVAASGTANWNGGAGFVPVGNSGTKFTGSFDGLGHTITGLTINRPANVVANNYQGLFGYADFGSTLRNVGLLNSSIAGANIIGALAGRSDGTVSNSYADGGSVSASVHQAGGLVGALGGTGSIGNSYAHVSVTGTDYACCGGGLSSTNIGGLVGTTLAGSSISNSYATGSVSGGGNVGGLVGQNDADIDTSYASGAVTANISRGGFIGDQQGGAITNSYWDSATTGVATNTRHVVNIAGVTDVAAAPNAQASYTGFDFTVTPVWRIYEGQTRPLLKSFLTPLTITANDASKIYDGLAYSGGNGVSYSTAPDANLLGTASYGGSSQGALDAGSYAITVDGLYSNQRGYDITFADGALTVNQAALTVTANDAAKTYDGLAYSGGNGVGYSGFVNGETSAVLGGALAWGGNSQGAVNAGNYAITASGLTSGNYAIHFVDGTLVITIVSPVPVVPGAPPDGYTGAFASLPSGAADAAGPTLLASMEDSGEGEGALPSLSGLTIIPCGQTLPPAIANSCQ